MLYLYIQSIRHQIQYLKEMGCSNDVIVKKIQLKYRNKLCYQQTKNMNEVINFILNNKKLNIQGKSLQFVKEV